MREKEMLVQVPRGHHVLRIASIEEVLPHADLLGGFLGRRLEQRLLILRGTGRSAPSFVAGLIHSQFIRR